MNKVINKNFLPYIRKSVCFVIRDGKVCTRKVTTWKGETFYFSGDRIFSEDEEITLKDFLCDMECAPYEATPEIKETLAELGLEPVSHEEWDCIIDDVDPFTGNVELSHTETRTVWELHEIAS